MSKKLRVVHFPQIPCRGFIVKVESLEEAKKVMDVLANYDLFQYEECIKGDYANSTILEEWDKYELEWIEWMDSDGRNIDEYLECLEEEE